jgi:hydrogenase maturation protease
VRRDDALGIHAAHALGDYYRDRSDVRTIPASQLSWELAEDLSQSDFVLFLDASAAETPGTIVEEQLDSRNSALELTHHCTPGTLLITSMQLYGKAPCAASLTMVGSSFDVGVGLSPLVQGRFEEFLNKAKLIVSEWLHEPASPRARKNGGALHSRAKIHV